MFSKLLNAIKDGTLFEKIANKINSIWSKRYVKYIKKRTSIDSEKVMFLSFQGNYTCNNKAICNEIIKRKLKLKLVWSVRKEYIKDSDMFPKELKLVIRGSKEFYKELASAKYIIQNANESIYLNYNKRDEQIIIQTWHGSLGFKKINPDNVNNENWVKKTSILASETDYIVSNSKFENMVYRTSYWKDTPILEYGHPRNDVLFNNVLQNKISSMIKEKYNIPKSGKILLYAPTYRDDFSEKTYDIDYDRLISALSDKFNGDWYIMLRYHFKLRNLIPKRIGGKVIDVSDYYDIQDLICACDIGLTDYSSWLCDLVLTKKPGLLYTNDIDTYNLERGFYYNLSETPFPISCSQDELIDNIKKFDVDKYEKRRLKFLEQKGCFEDGKASERLIEKFFDK